MPLTKVTYSMIKTAPINVVDFGADPTDVVDSAVAINAAITAANANGINAVYLPAGVYKCASTITILNNITLYGEGYASALHFLPSGHAQTAGITVANKSNFSIRNLRVYGDSTSLIDLTWAIRIYGSTNGFVENCTINTAYIGVFVGDVSITQSSSIQVRNNVIHNIGLNAIGVNTFGSRINILGNTIYQSGTLSSLANVGSGIEFRGATNSVIGSNIFDELQYGAAGSCDGIRLEYATEGATQQVKHVSVVNNTVSNFSGFGIRGQMILNCALVGNTFYSSNASHESGILLLSSDANAVTSAYNSVSGNTFLVSGVVSNVSAITLSGGAATQKINFNNITGNTVNGYRNGVVLINANDNAVSNNVISNCTAQAVYHISGVDNLISANKCTDNGATGIEIVAGTNITLSMNESVNNATYGIFLSSSATTCNVLWNITRNNSTANYTNSGGTAISASFGTGTPEAAVTASVGSQFLRTDGGAGTTLYVKQTGTGNTGWAGK